MKTRSRKSHYSSLFIALALCTTTARAATPYVMSTGDYSQNFSDMANWGNDFVSGIGAANWGSVAVNSTGTIPDGIKTTSATTTFVATSSTGVQRGTNVPGIAIVLLPTGTTDNSTAIAIDLYLDFTGRNAGTLSFDWSAVANNTGNRAATLKVYATPDGTTFSEVSGTTVTATNFVVGSGSVSSIALPASLNGSATARLRFYCYNGPGVASATGSRPKIAIDNVAVTATGGADTQPTVTSVTPATLTTNAGATVAFTVSATGGNLSYFWYKHSGATSNLIGGATTSKLTLANVVKADATNYSVVVSNSVGLTNSSVVTLDVNDPAIVVQPQTQIAIIGSNATFTVTAAGTGLSYQWLLEGTNISGATTSSYTRPAVTYADQGGYQVVVTGTYGSVTSAVAQLTVSLPHLATWNFNNTNDSLTSPLPSDGNGIAATLGGITPVFFSGVGSSDPTTSTNGAWGSQNYPAAGAANKSAGVEFRVNTSGFKDIVIRWDERESNTASRYKRFQYTLDGVNYVDDIVLANTSGGTFVARTNDLTSITGANNNPNFGFRLVTEFESTATGTGSAAYIAVNSTSTYDSSGTIRYDYVVVSGNSLSGGPSPIPLTIQIRGSDAVLSWSDAQFHLQSAPDVTGTYTNVPNATSPHTNTPLDAQKFFRLKYP